MTDVWVSVFFLSTGTEESLRALKAAFICIVLLILVLSEVSATECTLPAPLSMLRTCAKEAVGLIFQRMDAAPRTVKPLSSSPLARTRLM